jgi:signal transduction histidine kinase/tetratricopeptide (TPR) repeat protein
MTTKKYLFLLLLLPLSLFAQNQNRIATIKKNLALTTDQERYDLLSDLAWEYRFANPDSTLLYCKEAIALGEKLALGLGVARPYNFAGVAYQYKGDKLNAYQYFSKALDIATNQIDSIQIAHAKNNLGRLFFDQGLLQRAYPYFVEALKLFELMNDSSGMAYAYQSIANLYRVQKDYVQAEANYLKALAIRIREHDTRNIQSAFTYLGRLYQEAGDLKKSTQYLLKADSASQVIKDKINQAEVKTFIAENYFLENKLQDAQRVFLEAFDLIKKLKNIRLLPRCHNLYGQILLGKDSVLEAKAQFETALFWAKSIKELESQMEAYLYLSQVAKRLSNKELELTNYNLYLIIRDSINDLDVARKVERLQFELRIQKEEQENEALKLAQAKNEAIISAQRAQNIALAVIALALLAAGTVFYYTSKRRQKANLRLERKNNEILKQRQEILNQNTELATTNKLLSDLNHEKDTLMSIVAHDLKSPLNRIRGLIEVIRLEGGIDENKMKLVKMIEDAANGGLYLITDLLDVHEIEENTTIHLETVGIATIISRINNTFKGLAQAKEIKLTFNFNETETVYSNAEYLSRILDNLVSNAIKFSKRGSEVVISTHKTENEFKLSVKDNGPGFTQHDRLFIFQKFKRLSARPTGGESSNGLGLAIVKTLADRLKGDIQLDSEPGKGSVFTISFKN